MTDGGVGCGEVRDGGDGCGEVTDGGVCSDVVTDVGVAVDAVTDGGDCSSSCCSVCSIRTHSALSVSNLQSLVVVVVSFLCC